MLQTSNSCKFLIFLLIINIERTYQQQQQFATIFKQDENLRNTKGKELLKIMDLKVDPCKDFYAYTCGKWDKLHTTNKHDEIITPDSLLEGKINDDLEQMLRESVTTSDGNTGRKMKQFFKTCINAQRNGTVQQAFFSDFIKENGGFPAIPGSNWQLQMNAYDWQLIVGQLRHRYGMNILIGVDIDVNPLNTYENSMILKEPNMLIPPHLCNSNATQIIDISDREYERIEQEVAENLRIWLTLTKSDAQQIAAEIVLFEFELCTAIKAKESIDRNPTQHELEFIRRNLKDITRHFNYSIDFNTFIATSFGTQNYKPVYLHSELYFNQLIATINDNNKTTLANYIMYRALSYLSFPINDTPNKRAQNCVNIMKQYFAHIIGEMYQRKYVPEIVRSDLQIIFDKLKETFMKSLKSTWIEESTSRIGIKKLHDINLGLPIYDKININLQIDNENYWLNLVQAMTLSQQNEMQRAYTSNIPRPKDDIESYEIRIKYRSLHKRIDMGWGLIRQPNYNTNYPNAMRYAVIGQKIARELATAFDDLGWTDDIKGIAIWDRFTRDTYFNYSLCFRQQISNYLYNNPDIFLNITKLREIIAESSGLNIAFRTYLNWLDYLSPNNDFNVLSKETLKDFNFTNTQLFFITFAQQFCRVERKKHTNSIISPLTYHSFERYLINGPLRNSREFYKEFGCLAGTEMNIADKCIIY